MFAEESNVASADGSKVDAAAMTAKVLKFNIFLRWNMKELYEGLLHIKIRTA